MIENHFTESGEATFLAPNLLVHFRESLHRISGESLLSNKLFDRAHARFTGESTMRALPNRPQLDSLCKVQHGLGVASTSQTFFGAFEKQLLLC